MGKNAVIIGAGIGGLAVSALLAKEGHNITIVEKNDQIGGRARIWKKGGFSFDMGPSWYLMPEIFDHFFTLFDKNREDFYTLKKLDPAYRVFFSPEEHMDIRSDRADAMKIFEGFEKNGGKKLDAYLTQAEYKYSVALKEFLYRDYGSIFDFFNRRIITEGLKLKIFSKLDKFVRGYFHDRRAIQILEYAMVFLGTSPVKAPALYTIMSHLDLTQGVFYPEGGLSGVARAFGKLAESQGAAVSLNNPAKKIRVKGGRVQSVETEEGSIPADIVVVNSDYVYAENNLLDREYRSFSPAYWNKRVYAPSMFLIYMGTNKKLNTLTHHNLYFTENWGIHFDKIFEHPQWPDDPCFYVSCISKTDKDSAPEYGENVFILVPVAPGLDDNDDFREEYAERTVRHIENITGADLHSDVAVKRIFSHRDFTDDYNAHKGTALGLAHTLRQTAVFRPPIKSKKVGNLFYTGQYTRPGIGVPMVVISSQLAAEHIKESLS